MSHFLTWFVLSMLLVCASGAGPSCSSTPLPPSASFVAVPSAAGGNIHLDYGDVDGDGWTDIVTNKKISFANGGLSFTSYVHPSMGTGYMVEASDLDNDGYVDMIAFSPSLDRIAWWKSNGAARSLQNPVEIGFAVARGSAGDFHVEDLDGNGFKDVVVTQGDSGTFETVFFFQTAANVWASPEAMSHTERTYPVLVFDIGGDGVKDALVFSSSDQEVYRFSFPSVGTVVAAGTLTSFGGQTRDAVKYDMNGDGVDEIISLATANGPATAWFLEGATVVPKSLANPTCNFGGGSMFELDGDSAPDVFSGRANAGRLATGLQPDPETYHLSSCTTVGLGQDGRDGEIVDVTADGWLDAVYDLRSFNYPTIFAGFPIPPFPTSPSLLYVPPSASIAGYVVGDLDADSDLDVVVALDDGSLSALLNDGGGSLGTPVDLTGSTPGMMPYVNSSTLALVDLNLDGALDIVAAPTTSNVVYAYMARDTALYTSSPSVVATSGVHTSISSILFTSCDGNDWTDLVVAGSGGVSIFLPTSGPGAYTTETVVYSGSEAEQVLASDLDGDTIVDLAFFSPSTGTLFKALGLPGPPLGTFATHVPMATGLDASLSSLHVERLSGPPGPPSMVWRVDGDTSLYAMDTVSHTITTPMTFSSQPSAFVALDVERNGLSHVVWASADVDAVSWMAHSARTGLGDAANSRPVATTMAGGVRDSISLVDLEGDGYYGVLYVSHAGLTYAHPPSPLFLAKRLSAAHLHLEHPECGGVTHTLSCLNAALARATPCFNGYNILKIPPSLTTVVGCTRVGDALEIRSRAWLRFSGGHPTGTLSFDCGKYGGGAVFRIPSGGELAVEGRMEIQGASPSGGALSHAPMVVRGTLWLDKGGRFVDNSNQPPLNVFQVSFGRGGVFSLFSGATVVLADAVFEGNRAASSGGAIAVEGTVSLKMSNVTFRSNVAVDSGGALFLTTVTGMTETWTDIVVDGNRALGGSGGGIYCSGASASLSFPSLVLTNNQADAGAGGGAALVGPSLIIVDISGPGSRVAGNSGAFGGAFALWTGANPTKSASVWELSSYSVDGPSVSLSTDTVLGDASGGSGGLVYACAGTFSASGAILEVPGTTGSFATSVGGLAFLCADSPPGIVAVPPAFGSSVSPTGYGPGLATPPVRLEMAEEDKVVSVPSGVPIGERSVILRDEFDSQVTEGGIELAVSSPPAIIATIPVVESDAASAGVPLGALAFTVLAWPDNLEKMYFAELAPQITPSWDVETVVLNVTLLPCPPGLGRISGASSPLTCAVCGPGTFSTNTSTDGCELDVACPADAIAYQGVCYTCAPNTYRLTGGGNSTGGPPEPCECIPGFWTPSRERDTECFSCPVGAVCAGGLAWPVARPGWYPISGTADGIQFTKCPIPGACTGGLSCQDAYASDSYVCKDCAESYFRQPDSTCDKCPDSSVVTFTLLFVLLLGAAVVGVVIVVVTAVTIEKQGGLSRHKTIPHAATILVLFFQILGILARAPLNWPEPPVQQVLDAANVANIQLSFFATDCTMTEFGSQYALAVGLPLVLVIWITIFVLVIRVFPRCMHLCCITRLPVVETGAFLERLLFTFGPLLYIPLSRSTLTFFDCTKLTNGKYYLDAEYSVECFSSEWLSLLPLAIVAFLLYVVFLPAFFAIRVFRARHTLDEPAVQLRLGPIYHLYLRRFFYFEVVLLLKRLGIVSGALFFSSIPVLLFGSLFFLFIGATVFQLKHEPFHNPLHNALENTVNVSILVLIVCGMMFWADSFPDTASFALVVCIAVAVVVCAVVHIIRVGIKEAMDHRRTRRVSSEYGGRLGTQHDRALVAHLGAHLPDVDAQWLHSSLVAIVDDEAGDVGKEEATPLDMFRFGDDDDEESSAGETTSSLESCAVSSRRTETRTRTGTGKRVSGSGRDEGGWSSS